MDDSHLKAKVSDFVDKIISQVDITVKKTDVNSMVDQFYKMGQDDIEVQLNMNITQNSQEIAFLKDYTFNLIKSLNIDTKEKLRDSLSRGLLNNENNAQLSKRVSQVLDLSRKRAVAIVRTETNRIYNTSRQTAVERSGIKMKKFVFVALDHRTSGICKRMHNKYGSPKQAIPLTSKFKDDVTGERFDTTPFHVNCRSRIGYTTE